MMGITIVDALIRRFAFVKKRGFALEFSIIKSINKSTSVW